MPLIRISQYNQENLPRELNDKLYDLARRKTDRPFSTSKETLYLLAFDHEALLGFIELKCEAPIATLKNIVVDSSAQEQNIALKLLRACLAQVSKTDCERIQLACQEQHIKLFKRAGFVVVETPEKTGSTQFYIMENACPDYYLNVVNQRASAKDNTHSLSDSLIIGQDTATHNFTNDSHYLQLHHRLISQARKQIWILCDTASNPTLDNTYTSQCLMRLIKRNPNTEIRLLLVNDKIGAGYFNPTINLAQRLTSYVEIRTLSKTGGAPFKEMITLVDFKACLYRRSLSSMTGFANFNNPLMAQRLKHQFEHHWAFSKPSMQLRRLAI